MTREQLKIANELEKRVDQYTQMCDMLKNLNGSGRAALQEYEGPYGGEYTHIGRPVHVDEAMRQILYAAAYNLLIVATNEFAQFLNPAIPA